MTAKMRHALLRVQAANRVLRDFECDLEQKLHARSSVRRLLAEAVEAGKPTAEFVERSRKLDAESRYARSGVDQAMASKHEADEELSLVVLAEHGLDPFGDPDVAIAASLTLIKGGAS